MKNKKIQNITIVTVAVIIVGSIMAYNYSVEQTRQQGLRFGIELEMIQEDVKQLQTEFYSTRIQWEEGDITKEQLESFYDTHLADFQNTISEYDNLEPPEIFSGSVQLLKLSSESQLESDKQFIEWIKTGDESSKVRSDARLQESLEYELHGLVEFYSAKTGIKTYDESEKFTAPQRGLAEMVDNVYNNMIEECDTAFTNDTGEFSSSKDQLRWTECMSDADTWKIQHQP